MSNGTSVSLNMEGVRWARRFISDTQQGATPRKVNDVVQAGQQVWVRQVGSSWWLSQVPDVNSALVSINPQNGAIIALVGGFDFNQSKFNRATQALRQVGSNIKPFLYTAAMDKGLTLASMLNDVPISRWDAGSGSDWRPKTPRRSMRALSACVRGWVNQRTLSWFARCGPWAWTTRLSISSASASRRRTSCGQNRWRWAPRLSPRFRLLAAIR
jgi:membrane carboxypeptidase/penicillin-binding protein